MRCERCKASCEEHYAESNETEWYCKIGVPDEEMNEDKNGLWGCKLHHKTIEKKLRIKEEAWLKDKEQWVAWFLKEEWANENEPIRKEEGEDEDIKKRST